MGWVILGILRCIGYFYWILPRKVQVFLGRAVGSLFYISRFRYEVVDQNLNLAFPDGQSGSRDFIGAGSERPNQSGNADLRAKIARESYGQFGNLIFEILLLLGPMKKFVLRYVDLKGLEHLQAAKARGKGVIFLASHTGNWEVMAATGGILAKTDLMLVTKHLKPEWLHQAIESGRAKCGVTATYEPRTMRDVLSHLKKNGTVGIVLDQYVGPPVGVRVPLFGVTVGTSQVVATLAKRTGAVVLPVENFRTPDGRWDISVHPPVEWKEDADPNRELALNTADYTAIIEKIIRAHPEQWLWIHRRFKGDLSPVRPKEWSEPRVRR